MNLSDRRGLNLGVALVAIGAYFILARSLSFRGPGPILLLVGGVLFVVSALRRFRGPLLPAGVLLGLGAAMLLREPLERWLPHWATLCAGLGAGFLLVAGLDRHAGRERHPAPVLPGVALLAIAAAAAFSHAIEVPDSFYDAAWRLWPFALVAAGVILVLQALKGRKAP